MLGRATRHLEPRPDHEQVDASRALLAAARDKTDAAATEEEEERLAACREVVRLEEEHEAYGALLRNAEEKLEHVYRMAMHGRDIPEAGGGDGNWEEAAGAVDEEVVRVLKEAEEGRTLERVDLADRRQLRLLPEPVGRIRGLLALDVSRNQLKVRDSCTPTVHAPLPPPSLSLSLVFLHGTLPFAICSEFFRLLVESIIEVGLLESYVLSPVFA